MTNKKTTLFLTILASLVLFILTFTQFKKLLEFLMPRTENLQYHYTHITTQFKLTLFFSIIIGLTPLFLILTWRLGRIDKTVRRIYSGFIVVFLMSISIALKYYLVKLTLYRITDLKTKTSETINNSFAIEDLNFESYLLAGLILGCIVSYFLFKKNRH